MSVFVLTYRGFEYIIESKLCKIKGEVKLGKKVAFISLGCKVNQYETNAMSQEFIENGYEVVEFTDVADVYIVNTCTVTNIADRKSRQMLRRVKEINPEAVLVACGCYAQVGKDELEKIDDIDLIIGNNEKKDIVEIIENYQNEKNAIISDVMHKKEYVEFGTTTYTEKTRAVVKIQDGCDRFCSYCIIPFARGRVRSRKIENIISEVEQIVDNGMQEIVITGIHIASYGKDFNYEITLIDLLEELNKIDGLKRIRLGSIEPTIITDEFVSRLAKLDKICDHFHLSLQSGCDETLRRMNRRYTCKEFEDGTKLLRKAFPNAALTTDVIVGFPGETDDEFNATYEFLKKIAFYKMHIFKYSQRKGTKAAVMPNQIDGSIKEQRSKVLLGLSDENEEKYNSEYVDKIVEVLFEEKDGDYYKGHTKNYIEVWAKGDNLENKIVNVKVEKNDRMHLIGSIAK
ncbi:MAG: tRNA (N(6)-L-threonylcarbamoyladenosine(37)-C(2))-methylthiotransferase MtaB [Clostridia bacterium]|nr:tRNA (N(6)-L-threonylcarbamoyladenosine(37)-C(2))-methylthiotransferase MtaB [Clostridia bacterium]